MSLELQNLQIFRDGKPLLPAQSLIVENGEILTLMGPSGIGKSTILSAIIGTIGKEFHVEGDIFLDDLPLANLAVESREIGLIFQDALLFPHLNIENNLGFGLMLKGEERREMIKQALKIAGLEGFENRDPATLSGGEASRVALMRALLAKPKALLLDEPFSKLDQSRRGEIRAFTFQEIKRRQIPAILVTHDESDAKATNGRVIHLG